ncbi:phosphoribosylanthranilate isomerase [Hymenobacter nivis]|uniref:N-(5'-phosphoribosyl)anthranilate isomerase n=1 Tax=Hymenobacter nivis TaxID=1850093 RepID=A0A502GK84_9BACT|nr:phosphoribosylanthranilate isomerase [Hymenobacter nivis]TPG61770.1 phosphoribosylanthranilate isomerase [Hymenobacter nivis]
MQTPAPPPAAPPCPEAAFPRLLVKVCGMREAASLAAVADQGPDFLGFIFAPASPRYVGDVLTPDLVHGLPEHVQRVGVFVDAPTAQVLAIAYRFGLNYVQLHGHETPAQCAEIRAAGLRVIKAFGVGEGFDFDTLGPYVPHCDFFLFDALGPAPGGNGRVFDWRVLEKYPWPVPYLLAGGLRPEHAAVVRNLQLPGLAGIDLNSGLETAPGVKDPARVAAFFDGLGRSAAA